MRFVVKGFIDNLPNSRMVYVLKLFAVIDKKACGLNEREDSDGTPINRLSVSDRHFTILFQVIERGKRAIVADHT